MDMDQLNSTHIGRRITISFPESGTDDQVTGTLDSVSHRKTADKLRSVITLRVAEKSLEFEDRKGGRWRQELKINVPMTS